MVPAFASEVESDLELDLEYWYVDPAVPFDVTYHLSFQDSYINDFDIHTFTYAGLPAIPLNGIFQTSPLMNITFPRFSVESGNRSVNFGTTISLSSVISDYSHFSQSGTLRFNYNSLLQYSMSRSGSYPVALDFCELSAPDFFAFSHEDYGNIDSDQNSQLMLIFEETYINTYCDIGSCSISFSYAPITDSGLGEFEIVQSDFSSFADLDSGIYIVDPGRIIRSPSSSGEVDFYMIRDFSLILVPSEGYKYPPVSEYVHAYEFKPTFNCSFVYDPQFSDPSFINPGGAMELRDYTSWITTAVSGFFDIQIFPGFYLPGF